MTPILSSQLTAFRATHRPIRATFADATWSYVVGGNGRDTIVLLPGAPGIAEMAFAYVLAFEQHHRVIVPSYPPTVGSLEQLIAGLDALVERETDGPFHLIGASYSGLVVQYLLHSHHPRLKSLLIGDTGIPRSERGRMMAKMLATVNRFPPLGLHAFLFLVVNRIVKGNSPEHRFWKSYLKGVVVNMTRREFANRIQILVDMDMRGHTIQPFAPWNGPTLLMETADDPLFAPSERATLRERFPHAQIHTTYNQGHTTALTRSPEYIAVMGEFLLQQRM